MQFTRIFIKFHLFIKAGSSASGATGLIVLLQNCSPSAGSAAFMQ
jgi:hypothetical protein